MIKVVEYGSPLLADPAESCCVVMFLVKCCLLVEIFYLSNHVWSGEHCTQLWGEWEEQRLTTTDFTFFLTRSYHHHLTGF